MKLCILLDLFIFCSLTLSAQCSDYQSEMQNVESDISIVIKNLKKASDAVSLVEAQQFVDKAAEQTETIIKSANMAKEYATSCNCREGINTAANIYTASFDCRTQTQKAAEFGLLDELKESVKKILKVAETIKDEASEGSGYCLE